MNTPTALTLEDALWLSRNVATGLTPQEIQGAYTSDPVAREVFDGALAKRDADAAAARAPAPKKEAPPAGELTGRGSAREMVGFVRRPSHSGGCEVAQAARRPSGGGDPAALRAAPPAGEPAAPEGAPEVVMRDAETRDGEAPPAAEFKLRFATWAARGFEAALVPVVPGGVPADRWQGGAANLGKCPAWLDGDRWRPLPGWQRVAATPALRQTWDAWGASVGVRTKNHPTWDSDIDDPKVAQVAEHVIVSALELFGGTAAVRRRAGSARFAIPTRLEGPPLRKATLSFKLPDGRPQKIELLGDGQQFVAEGVHRSGARLAWSPAPPVAEELPRLGAQLAEMVFQEIEGALARLGCTDIERSGGGGQAGRDGPVVPAGEPARGEEPHREDEVRSALAALDPDLPYPEWLELGMALRAGLGDDGLAVWDDWSSLGAKYVPGEPARKWATFAGEGVGLGTLFQKALAAGWRFPAPSPDEDFGDPPPGGDGGGGAATGEQVRPEVKALNEDWFVLDEAGRLFVSRFVEDALGQGQRRRRLVHYTFEAFRQKFERVAWRQGGRRVTLGQAWLAWKRRRQYDRAVFDPRGARYGPEVLNLWQGFAVEPAPGDWSVVRRHVEEVVCAGDAEHARYLLGWMARLFQRPWERGEVAVVLRGKEGVGKSVLGYIIRRALGQHGLAVSKADHVVGRFNSHLRDLLFLQADEAFFAGDPRQGRQLLGLVTDDTLPVEAKGVDLVPGPNLLHLLLTTNEDWAVRAGPESRRFFVLDVSGARRRDRVYFEELWRAADDDRVVAAMLHDLLAADLSKFDVRQFPVTESLREQRARSLTGALAWAADVAERGYLAGDFGQLPWREFFTTGELYEDYRRWSAEQRGAGPSLPRDTLARWLTRLFGPSRETPRSLYAVMAEADRRRRGFEVGTLADFAATVRRAAGLEDEAEADPAR